MRDHTTQSVLFPARRPASGAARHAVPGRRVGARRAHYAEAHYAARTWERQYRVTIKADRVLIPAASSRTTRASWSPTFGANPQRVYERVYYPERRNRGPDQGALARPRARPHQILSC